MNPFRLFLALCAASCLSACGNLQLAKLAEVPSTLKGSPARLTVERPLKQEIAPRGYEVVNRSTFFQQTSGGSLAVGLLLGPLGVLANMSNIDRITEEMGKSGQGSSLYQVDALKEASDALEMAPETVSTGETTIALKPFILFYVADEKRGIQTVVGLRAEAHLKGGDGKAPSWIGHYNCALTSVKKLDALKAPMPAQEFDDYKNEIREAYKQARGEFQRDFSTSSAPKRQIAWVNSSLLGIGAPGDVELGPAGRLSLRINMNNYGPAVSKTVSYVNYIFTSPSQYTFDNGPVDRQDPGK